MIPSTPTDGPRSASRAAQLAGYLRRPFEALAFWVAIALPFVYLPLLYAGFDDTGMVAFVGLLAANAVALYVGHGHNCD